MYGLRRVSKTWRRTVGAAILAVCVTALPAHAETLRFKGVQREYVVYVPDQVRARQTPAPLLFVLHGGGGFVDQIRRFVPFDEIARRDGAIVVYPQGLEKHWNDGRTDSGYRAHRENIDDVGFLKSLIDVVDKQHARVDRKRVYATGISNGGMMALRLACEASDAFAAVAAFAANVPTLILPFCRTDSSIGVVVVNGTADPLVPYDGGQVSFGKRSLGLVISTDATMALFAKLNGCSAQPLTTALPDVDPNDRTRVTHLEWTGCRSPVTLYRVDGGGHTWPGASQYLPKFLVGRVSRDIDGTEVAWTFLKAQARH